MEFKFNKSSIRCMHSVLHEVKDQELTQDVKLSEGMGDVGRILACNGQIMVRNKQWRNGTFQLNGGVLAWIIYEPEAGGSSYCVETWMPFQMRCDSAESDSDAIVSATALLRDISARQIAGRKLLVRAEISVLFDAFVSENTDVFEPCDLPDDVHVLRENYPIIVQWDQGDKTFSIDESLSLSDGCPLPKKICSYNIYPVVSEQKIMGDKLLFRGVTSLHIVYKDDVGEICGWNCELPFSQYVQLEKECSAVGTSRVIPIVSSAELELSEDGKIQWKAGITCQYAIFDSYNLALVKDAYSTKRKIHLHQDTLSVPAVLSRETVTHDAQQPVNLGSVRTTMASFAPEHPRVYSDADGYHVEIGGKFSVFGFDNEGVFRQVCSNWDDTFSVAAADNVKLDVMLIPNTKASVMNDGLKLTASASLQLDVIAFASDGIPMITGIDVGEPVVFTEERPGLIIKRAGDMCLWDIAKESGSTVSAIKEANGLQQEPNPDQVLLIPVI